MLQKPLPKELWHRDRRAHERNREHPKDQPLYNLSNSNSSAIESSVVALRFIKDGTTDGGNGFFVNVPGTEQGVIFTAGHNLIDEKKNRTKNLEAWWQGQPAWVKIDDSQVRISRIYEANPTAASGISDYGAILLPKAPGTTYPGFGFALKLAEEERLEPTLSITSYKAGSNIGANPSTSTGPCMNPIINKNQLEYKIDTEGGVSGSAVWVGYNKYPTVVAIHNYGPKRAGPKYGSRGTRINLTVLREIFQWVGVFQENKRILVKSPSPPAPALGLRLIYSPDDQIIRVVVGESEPDRAALERFDVLPVYSSAVVGTKPTVEYGFRQADSSQESHWISWDKEWECATLASALDRSKLADWALKGKTTMSTISRQFDGTLWEVIVKADSSVVKPWDLDFPGAEFSGISYQKKGARTKDSFSTFVLE
ncbi:hypothetical protein GGR51DRAFT_287819 [Nemania sp. FL0031]|nr:hypothetical protein GGR51DRAFT_287819 [Nemania sp. FL0031]